MIKDAENFLTADIIDMLIKVPMYIRVGFILNTVTFNSICDENIPWEVVNRIINFPSVEYDYNYFIPDMCGIADLYTLDMNIKSAEAGIGVWRTHTCKSCGEVFSLTKSEVDFFKFKELNVPKRCKKCRDSAKVLKEETL